MGGREGIGKEEKTLKIPDDTLFNVQPLATVSFLSGAV